MHLSLCYNVYKKCSSDQSVDTMPLLKIGNKTPMEGVTETKFGAEMKGAIPRDPSHNQPPNADTITHTSKILLKEPRYSCLL